MTLKNLYDDSIVTIKDLFDGWKENRKTDPENYSKYFVRYMIVIIMDTINGRNDYNIIDLTPTEIERLLKMLWKVEKEYEEE